MIPKNGFTQWTGLLTQAALALGGRGIQKICCFNSLEKLWISQSLTRAIMVRFPPSRYLSAYLDKYTKCTKCAGSGPPSATRFALFVRNTLATETSHNDHGLGEHWLSQAFFCHLGEGARFSHVWKLETFPYTDENETIGLVFPRAAWSRGFGVNGSLSFAQSMQKASIDRTVTSSASHATGAASQMLAYWSGELLVFLLCARPLETRLLWQIYIDEYSELARALNVTLAEHVDVATGECRIPAHRAHG